MKKGTFISSFYGTYIGTHDSCRIQIRGKEEWNDDDDDDDDDKAKRCVIWWLLSHAAARFYDRRKRAIERWERLARDWRFVCDDLKINI
jgi:hypothetical protein